MTSLSQLLCCGKTFCTNKTTEMNTIDSLLHLVTFYERCNGSSQQTFSRQIDKTLTPRGESQSFTEAVTATDGNGSLQHLFF